MNYRSITDLSNTIRENLYKLPRDIDLVVGIPRSGMLAANIIALNLNLKLTDLAGYEVDTPLKQGFTRNSLFSDVIKPSHAKHVLIVDDSIYTGGSLEKIKRLIDEIKHHQKITYCAVYSTAESAKIPDVFMEIVPQPRTFEWNVMHRPHLAECCLDIDGVLCLDPTDEENDDGQGYINFLRTVPPLLIPSFKIGHLVTSRLEKYRDETELWLKKHGFNYGELHMLDLPDASTRRRLGCHATFKADVYRKLVNTELFIESDVNQSINIAHRSGKPVLCFSTQKIYYPEISYVLVKHKTLSFSKRVLNKIKRVSKRFFN